MSPQRRGDAEKDAAETEKRQSQNPRALREERNVEPSDGLRVRATMGFEKGGDLVFGEAALGNTQNELY